MNDNTIKMFIGGEEVVSNREFTINEEMLSASSTILNNCYPASWEQNKDYASNFYYPKDYSKYILGKGNFTYGTDQYYILTESGNNFIQFTTNVEKEWNSFNVYGKTTQETRSGKNLFNINATYRANNSTVSRNETGFNAVATGALSRVVFPISVVNGQSYNISLNYTSFGEEIAPYVRLRKLNNDGDWISDAVGPLTIGHNSFTLTATSTGDYFIWFYFNSSSTVINYDVTLTNIQFEVGHTETSYEKYGVQPSPDYPSELVSVGYENLINKERIILGYFRISDGTYLASTSTTYKSTELIPISPSTKYYSNVVAFSSSAVGVTYWDDSGTFISGSALSSSHIYTTPSNAKYMRLSFKYANSDITDVDTLYLIKGTQPHSYIPYGKYGIEIKNIGKNLASGLRYGYYRQSDGVYVNSNIYSCSNEPIIVNGITNFVFSINGVSSNGYAYTYDSQGNYLGRKGITNNGIFTPLPDVKYFNYAFKDSTIANVPLDSKIQIEQGTQPTIFEEYKSNSQLYILDEPLRAIGNYKDKLYIDNGMLYIKRRTGKVIFNGSEDNWKFSSNGNGWYIAINDIFQGSQSAIISRVYSNYFTQTTRNNIANVDYGVATSNSKNVTFKHKDYITSGDKSSWLAWLSTHNTEVNYVLSTSVVEELGAIELPVSYNGINNVEINTGLETTEDVYYYWKNYDVLFAGIVKNSGDISLRPTDPKYCSLQILDYKTFLSESDTLDFVISDKTIAEAISMVVDAISGYGFILGTINISQADDIIGAYSTLNKTAYDVFQYLANISGSRWRARFVDSDTMAIDFYDPELLPRANDIDYTQQYWEDNKIVGLTFNYGTRDYRNKQIILSDEVYGGIDYTEVLLSNGYGTSYITQNNIANITSITVNGVEVEVITQSEKDLGVDADFYYTPGKNVVESTTSYTAGTQIIITYTPLVKGRQIVYNDEEVTRIATQTNTTGVISRYENRNDILSSDELENIAETYIKYKGKPEIILKLTTLNNDLFNIGEICYFNSPIADLAQDYMVKSKATNYTSVAGETNIFYTYELTSSFNSEKAINYFDNQRNKATGNIAEGESITRNIDINNSAMIIWENATITEISVSVDGDNALNSVLNSPFIQ